MSKNELESRIKICELSPRDGIQVFRKFIPTKVKIDLINELSFCGLKEIHITYFAHPKVILQTRDAEDVAKGIKRNNNVTYIGFIPNEVGFRRALHVKVDRISFFISVEENLNYLFFGKSTASLLEDFIVIVKEAKYEGLETEAFIVNAFGRKKWPLARSIADKLLKAGIDIIYFSNFGDIINKENLRQYFKEMKNINSRADTVGLHLYVSEIEAKDVIKVALDQEICRFATSLGGLGLRYINGQIVTLPDTETVIKLANLKGFNLERPKKIVNKIKCMVEEVGKL